MTLSVNVPQPAQIPSKGSKPNKSPHFGCSPCQKLSLPASSLSRAPAGSQRRRQLPTDFQTPNPRRNSSTIPPPNKKFKYYTKNRAIIMPPPLEISIPTTILSSTPNEKPYTLYNITL